MFLTRCDAAAAAWLILFATGATAQPADTLRAGKPPAAAAAAAPATAASATAPGYRSAFDGYRPFDDQAVQSWRESNALVGRIGGWQAYAREMQGGAADAGAPPPAAPSASGMSGMPGTTGGHGGMTMPPAGTQAAPVGARSGERKP